MARLDMHTSEIVAQLHQWGWHVDHPVDARWKGDMVVIRLVGGRYAKITGSDEKPGIKIETTSNPEG